MNEEFNTQDTENTAETSAKDSQGSESQTDEQGCTYHYSYKDENESSDTARWEPDAEKFNTAQEPPKTEAKKKKSKWWIPVVAAGGALLIGLIVAGVCIFNLVAKNITSAISGQINISGDLGQQIDDSTENFIESITGGDDSDTEDEEESTEVVINETEASQNTPSDTASIYLTDVSDVVQQVMPCVVSITSRTLVNSGSYGGFFNYYYGNQSSNSTQEVESGVGSGTIVSQNSKELLILTSYHVVEDCSSLYVTFCDNNSVDGYIKAVSEDDDIAIVAIRLADIPEETVDEIAMATLTDEQPIVGDGAIVIGNALGYGQSVVTGIISAIDREITVEGKTITVLQTDAAINSGNSGGCLLNSSGEIVGISEAKINSSTVEGMCYAISIHHYYDTIMEMLEQEPSEEADQSASQDSEDSTDSANTSGQSAYLGIRGYDIGSQLAASYNIPEGVYVVGVVSGGGAEAAGIEEGDVIIEIDGKTITSMTELQSELTNYEPGDEVTLGVLRYTNNSYKEIEVKVSLTGSVG